MMRYLSVRVNRYFNRKKLPLRQSASAVAALRVRDHDDESSVIDIVNLVLLFPSAAISRVPTHFTSPRRSIAIIGHGTYVKAATMHPAVQMTSPLATGLAAPPRPKWAP
jgi:hypothetical protein